MVLELVRPKDLTKVQQVSDIDPANDGLVNFDASVANGNRDMTKIVPYSLLVTFIKSFFAKADVGLPNVDNTSDLNKPISNATQAALNLKLNISNFTKAALGLGSVNNTADPDKPISTATQSALDQKIDSSTINSPLGVAGLDSNSKIFASLLPPLAISQPNVVASQAAMLALTAETVYVAIRTDLTPRKTFMLVGNPTVLGNWIDISSGDSVNSIFGRVGAVTAEANDYASYYQPLSTELGILAALSSSTIGRSLLQVVTKAAARGLIDAQQDLSLVTTAVGFNNQGIKNYSIIQLVETTTTRTLTASDNGQVIEFTNSGNINVTVNKTLPVGFNCVLIQRGSGQIAWVAGTDVTFLLDSDHTGHTKSKGVNSKISIMRSTNFPDAFDIDGSTAV